MTIEEKFQKGNLIAVYKCKQLNLGIVLGITKKNTIRYIVISPNLKTKLDIPKYSNWQYPSDTALVDFKELEFRNLTSEYERIKKLILEK